jgi:hypothetical protein
MIRIIFLFCFSFHIIVGVSQENNASVNLNKSMFLKQKLYGFSFNNSWTSFYNLKDDKFIKPGLGLHANYNYFFDENWGLAVQAGIQMRGTGIVTPDYENSIGDPDSTGRFRQSVRTFEIPIVYHYRSSKEVIKNGRMIFGLGIVPMLHQRVLRKWFSVDDGFHTPVSFKDNFDAIDVPIRFSSGLDVDAAGGNLFRCDVIMDVGLKNNFRNPLDRSKSSKHFLLGVQITFLF